MVHWKCFYRIRQCFSRAIRSVSESFREWIAVSWNSESESVPEIRKYTLPTKIHRLLTVASYLSKIDSNNLFLYKLERAIKWMKLNHMTDERVSSTFYFWVIYRIGILVTEMPSQPLQNKYYLIKVLQRVYMKITISIIGSGNFLWIYVSLFDR